MYWNIGCILAPNAHLVAQTARKGGGVTLICLWLINESPPCHQGYLLAGKAMPHHLLGVYNLGLHVG